MEEKEKERVMAKLGMTDIEDEDFVHTLAADHDKVANLAIEAVENGDENLALVLSRVHEVSIESGGWKNSPDASLKMKVDDAIYGALVRPYVEHAAKSPKPKGKLRGKFYSMMMDSYSQITDERKNLDKSLKNKNESQLKSLMGEEKWSAFQDLAERGRIKIELEEEKPEISSMKLDENDHSHDGAELSPAELEAQKPELSGSPQLNEKASPDLSRDHNHPGIPGR